MKILISIATALALMLSEASATAREAAAAMRGVLTLEEGMDGGIAAGANFQGFRPEPFVQCVDECRTAGVLPGAECIRQCFLCNISPAPCPVPSALEVPPDTTPDTTPYTRPVVPEDFAPLGRPAIDPEAVILDPEAIGEEFGEQESLERRCRPPRRCLADVVVSDPTLKETDTENDGETSIAVNPDNPDEIVITAFSGSWPGDAPLWHSMNGGGTWTKRFTINPPPGVPANHCPCDQTVDYGRENRLSGTFLAPHPGKLEDIYSSTTMDPTTPDFHWFEDPPGMGMAQRTNHLALSSIGFVDQPWLLVNRDPMVASQDNVYVAYSKRVPFPMATMRVTVAKGTDPPNFTIDNLSGKAMLQRDPPVEAGHRLAVDRTTGFIYSLWQQPAGPGADGSTHIRYMLNRSTDGGQTWILNGQTEGIMVAEADSDQPGPELSSRKFGTVNALLGGVLHAAVDPRTGALWYVYGNRDPDTDNNRLAMRVIVREGADRVRISDEFFVTGQVQAALPAVAVTDNGTVGVFYYTFDGHQVVPPAGNTLPAFTAHLSIRLPPSPTVEPPPPETVQPEEPLVDLPLLTFLSVAADDGSAGQRVLGDYMQMKAVRNTFYGAFTGNGAPFGRPRANHDPIFLRVSVGP